MEDAVTLAGIVDPEDIDAGQAEYERNCKRPAPCAMLRRILCVPRMSSMALTHLLTFSQFKCYAE